MSTASTTAIPTDAVKFKQWADQECPKWPDELMIKAVRAWHAKNNHRAYPKSCITDFDKAYAAWVAEAADRRCPSMEI